MALTKETIRLALTRVADPRLIERGGGDIVGSGAVEKISVCDGFVSVRLAGSNLHDDHKRGLMQQATAAVRLYAQQSGDELSEVHVEFSENAPAGGAQPPKAPQPESRGAEPRGSGTGGGAGHAPIKGVGGGSVDASGGLPGVKHIIAVGAGKGGVGKSTVAVNLAVGLARNGHAVGLMDGDIYGPSLPTMLGLDALETIARGNRLQPFYVHGVKAMTLGKLVEPDKPLIWRGPMAHGAFKQLVEQTEWGELDYLIIDLPPGTGDVALTMAQMLKLAGAVVVCTPQKVAQDDATRAARMFTQLGVDVLGVVENMSYFVGDDGKEYDLFGRGGAQVMAQRLGLPLLGTVPINMGLRVNSDAGTPLKNFEDRSPRNRVLAESLEKLVDTLEKQVALAAMRSGAARPELSIS